ncbi:LANO_0C09230g1_1 [Lachancea nothofagi CBS 11611]|uniref:LANO_0C09230g1_1 n=1 Tax=Lachancea nothofagi CBS 11611 TaxID=1266666 RepID=A0A1G4J9W4_9SACH|nr:LANO_0C09230g1_1 [Lachancea nothofagi CBS 11611]
MVSKRDEKGPAKGEPTRKKSKTSKPSTTQAVKDVKSTKKAEVKHFKKPKKTVKILSKNINYSLCIPVSILDSCKNLEQITHVVYQVAKSAIFFNAGEIVILDLGRKTKQISSDSRDHKLSPTLLIASLLQFFVTPPYLVKSVFKKEYQECLQIASKLPRISALPFMRYLNDDKGRFREGLAVTMDKPGQTNTKAKGKKKAYDQTKYINVGKSDMIELRGQLVPANVRVTVDVEERKVVSPTEAYGDYVGAQSSFGYHVRVAKNFGDIFTQSALPEGYTQSVWVNSGDYYHNAELAKNVKLASKIPRIEKILKPTAEEIESGDAEKPANLMVVFGKWDHLSQSFKQCGDMFENCEGAHQFFDGQLQLPGAVPEANIGIQDSCMIALTMLATL